MPAPGEELPADVRVVAGDSFRTLDIPLLRGRTFETGDDEAAFLLAVALLACWLPARRALRVSPMAALRVE